MKKLFRTSRWIHKYIGLFLVLFGIWMSISGILLNHPEWIAELSVPRWLTPPQYVPENWNRSALIEMVYSRENPAVGYFVGKMGLWKTADGSKTFYRLTDGLPKSHFYRKSYSLLLLEKKNLLLVGTEGGLFAADPLLERFVSIELESENKPVRKIIRSKDSVIVFTDSHVYVAPLSGDLRSFNRIDLQRAVDSPEEVSLVRLFFDLHGGKAWGLPGKLLFDLTGLVIIFLCFSAFYVWIFPTRSSSKKEASREDEKKRSGLMRFLVKNHNLLGMWFCVLLVLMSFTGIFMRPPLLAVIAQGGISKSFYPGIHKPEPWDEKIRNAIYLEESDEIIIAATDGLWSGPAGFSAPYTLRELDVPVFVMGATVFTADEGGEKGDILVGSFSGLFRTKAGHKAIDLFTGEEVGKISSVMPGKIMVTGYLKTPEGNEFATSHEKGLIAIGNSPVDGRFEMPAELAENTRLPLWNYLFEIHNGRFFKDILGNWYILLVPLGSILFFLVIISGIFDWCCMTFSSAKQDKRK